MLVSIPVSQGSPGLDLIDHRMRHCSKLEDSNRKTQFKCIFNAQIFTIDLSTRLDAQDREKKKSGYTNVWFVQ